MSLPVQDWFHAMVRDTAFLDRYPYFAPNLAAVDAVEDDSCLMAVSAGPAGRVRLHVNTAWFSRPERHAEFRGVLQHELHHVIAGHLDPVFYQVPAPAIMQVAKEITANENIAEPLPGRPQRWQNYEQLGVRPGQTTMQRYEVLLRAHTEGKWKGPESVRVRCCKTEADAEAEQSDLDLELDDLFTDHPLQGLLPGAGQAPGNQSMAVGAPAGHPSVDWARALQRVARRACERQQSLRRPSRRDPDCRRIGEVPGWGRRPGRSRLLVAIDTSSSMDASLFPRIAAELVGIARTANLWIVECDSTIQREYAFDGSLRVVHGRGGTDLRPVFARDVLGRLAPDAVVYFTDGEGAYPSVDPGVRTLWVLNGKKPFHCGFGQRVHMDGAPPKKQRNQLAALVRL
jgi:predicted metal-dependent peptidase